MTDETEVLDAIKRWNAGIVVADDDKKRFARFEQWIKEGGMDKLCAKIDRLVGPPNERRERRKAELKAMISLPVNMTRDRLDSNSLRPVKVIEFFTRPGRQPDVREVPLFAAQQLMRAFSGTFSGVFSRVVITDGEVVTLEWPEADAANDPDGEKQGT